MTSHVMSALADRQFCLTGQHHPLQMTEFTSSTGASPWSDSMVVDGSGKHSEETDRQATERMPSDVYQSGTRDTTGHAAMLHKHLGGGGGGGRKGGIRKRDQRNSETGSDSDSGNGTISSECLESPTQEMPSTLFQNVMTTCENEILGSNSTILSVIPEQSPDCTWRTSDEQSSSTTSRLERREMFEDAIPYSASESSVQSSMSYSTLFDHQLLPPPISFVYPVQKVVKDDVTWSPKVVQDDVMRSPYKMLKQLETGNSKHESLSQEAAYRRTVSESAASHFDYNNNSSSNSQDDITVMATPRRHTGAEKQEHGWSEDDTFTDSPLREQRIRNEYRRCISYDSSHPQSIGLHGILQHRPTYATSDDEHDADIKRREIHAKCQDMYGSRHRIYGSRDNWPNDSHGSRQDIQHDPYVISTITDSYHDICNNRRRYITEPGDRFEVSNSIRNSPCSFNIQGSRTDSNCADNEVSRRHFERHSSPNGSECSYGAFYRNNDNLRYKHSFRLVDSSPGNSTSRSSSTVPDDSFGRRYIPHHTSGNLGFGQKDSPIRNSRYTKRYVETSFTSIPQDRQWEMVSGDGQGKNLGSNGGISVKDYLRMRSDPHDYASGGRGSFQKVLQNTEPAALNVLPALLQPFSDDEPATLPRPKKPSRGSGVIESEKTNISGPTTPVKGQGRRPFRRWTNPGLTGQGTVTEMNQKPDAVNGSPNSRGSFWSTIFKSKKHSSTVSLASTTGTDTRNRIESGIESGSVGDVSLQSYSRESTVSIFDSVEEIKPEETPNQQQHPVQSSNFKRSASVPNPEARSGSSFLNMIRSRLGLSTLNRKTNTRKKKEAVSPTSNDSKTSTSKEPERPHLISGVNSLPNGQPGDVSSRLQSPPQLNDSTKHMTTFAILHRQSSMTNSTVEMNDGEYANQSEEATVAFGSEEAAGAMAAVAATASLGNQSPQACGSRDSKESKDLLLSAANREVIDVTGEVEEFIVFVKSSVTSDAESDERTILEEEFNEYKKDMIDILKEFIDRCKQMVIKSPVSCSCFLEELNNCRCSLEGVASKYRALVNCTSLPADRAKVADRVNTMATSFKQTVIAALAVTGRTVKHPKMRELRQRTSQLVSDLTTLMKTVREMNYNRISRRF